MYCGRYWVCLVVSVLVGPVCLAFWFQFPVVMNLFLAKELACVLWILYSLVCLAGRNFFLFLLALSEPVGGVVVVVCVVCVVLLLVSVVGFCCCSYVG